LGWAGAFLSNFNEGRKMNDNHAKYNDGELSPKEEKRHWKRLELEEEAREDSMSVWSVSKTPPIGRT
jgi:hypothetical protein